MSYSFVDPPKKSTFQLEVTPAMESGITDHVWELAELIAD